MPVFGRNFIYSSVTSPFPPNAANDETQGFGIGDLWLDSETGVVWTCIDGTADAAKWSPQSGPCLLGSLIGADMNVTTDQQFTMHVPLTARYAIDRILATNASIDLTAADGGIYSAAAKGGTAIVAAAQVYTALSTTNALLALTIAAAGSGNTFNVAPYLSLTGAQGAEATADFYIYGSVLPLG